MAYTVLETIRMLYDTMFSAEKKVADYILKHPNETISTNVTELATLSGVSDATVIRMCKRLGYDGYYKMKLNLSHDLGRSQREADEKKRNEEFDTVDGLCEFMCENLRYMVQRLDSKVLLECAKLIRHSRMVHLVAVGNTVPITMDLSFRLGRFGVPSTYSALPEHYLNQIHLANGKDCVIAVSKSGTTKQVLQAVTFAKQRKLKVIVITAHEYSPLSSMADYLLLSSGEQELFQKYGPDSHICEMAINDALLYFISKLGNDENEVDEVELLLSEFKL